MESESDLIVASELVRVTEANNSIAVEALLYANVPYTLHANWVIILKRCTLRIILLVITYLQ